MSSTQESPSRVPWFRDATILLAGLFLWACHHSVGAHYKRGFQLDLGSISAPAYSHAYFLFSYGILAGAGTVCIAIACASLLRNRQLNVPLTDGTFVAVVTGAAFLLPACVRIFVLEGAPVTDDESAYRFMAEVLAQGRLYADTHDAALFFDRIFMINDGKFYAQYFVGWPAIMALAVPSGTTGFVNSILLAMSVLPLFGLVQRTHGSRWARWGTVFFVGSPMVIMMAATELSHTSCLWALICTAYFFVRCREPDAHWRNHAAFAFFFSLAFFIRPFSTVGVGCVFVVVWMVREAGRMDKRNIAAFLVPALLLAGMFLYVNYAQTGDAFKPAYQQVITFDEQNDFRFGTYMKGPTSAVHNIALDDATQVMARNGAAFLRTHFALLGWSSSFLFLLIALFVPSARVWWFSFATFVLIHIPVADSGVDTIGPFHYAELILPVLMLTIAGLRTSELILTRAFRSWLTRIPITVAATLMIGAMLHYFPVRLTALHQVARDINAPEQVVAAANLRNAVVFVRSYTPRCVGRPDLPRHYVFKRPNNDPDLKNDVLWVNHLSLKRDKELMERHFPEREAWLLDWNRENCQVLFAPLEKLPPDFPPGPLRNVRDPAGNRLELYDESEDPFAPRGGNR